jgi:hypothetical protein
MSTRRLLDVIVSEFGLPERPRASIIPKAQVIEWMGADDLEALGALYTFVTDSNYSKRIDPPLTFSEYWDFAARYFERCLRQNPEGEWVHGRYDAGWEIARVFSGVWVDSSVPVSSKSQFKEWLGRQYKQGDVDVKRCIVDAAVEHLFENREIARFFDDWNEDSELRIAYQEASEWSERGGHTDLGRGSGANSG